MNIFRVVGRGLMVPFYSSGSRIISASQESKVSSASNPDWKIFPPEQQPYRNLKLRVSMSKDEIKAISDRYRGVIRSSFSQYYAPGIAPQELLFEPTGSAKYISLWFKNRERILERFINKGGASFVKDFAGAEMLIIGPGKGAAEVLEFIKSFPNLRSIHIVNILDEQFINLDNELQDYKDRGGTIKPTIYAYKINTLELPQDLTGSMDMVYHANVFDPEYFSPLQRQQSAHEIVRILKHGGIDATPVQTVLGSLFFSSSTFDNHEDGFTKYLEREGLIPLKRGNFQIRYKK